MCPLRVLGCHRLFPLLRRRVRHRVTGNSSPGATTSSIGRPRAIQRESLWARSEPGVTKLGSGEARKRKHEWLHRGSDRKVKVPSAQRSGLIFLDGLQYGEVVLLILYLFTRRGHGHSVSLKIACLVDSSRCLLEKRMKKEERERRKERVRGKG